MSIGSSRRTAIAGLLLWPGFAWAFENGISGHNRNGLSLLGNQASPLAPVNTVAPAVSGTATVGSVLSSTTGTWTNSPTSYAYQWQRGGANISGATNSTYTTVTADGGTSVSCNVTATNASGSAMAASNALAIASGAAAWTPALLPGLVAWYDAQNAASITLNGATVSQWNDVSGHAYNATQGTAANQPTYNSVGLNGYPALTFNGSTSAMLTSVPAGQFTTDIAYLCVLAGSTATVGPLNSINGLVSSPMYNYSNGGTRIGSSSNQILLTGTGWAAFSTPTLFEQSYDRPSDYYYDWKNATLVTTKTSTGVTSFNSTGALFEIGALQSTYFFAGTLGEGIAISGSGIIAADRQKAEGYLAWKWGLAGLLPAGHPFKAGPPDTNGNPMAVPPLLTGAESDGTDLGLGFTANGASLVAAPSIVAPDGTTGAVQKLTENSANAPHNAYVRPTGNPLQFTMSAYAKPAGRQYFTIAILDSASTNVAMAYFDVLNGVVTYTQAKTYYTIISVNIGAAANGFFKCTLSMAVNAGTAIAYGEVGANTASGGVFPASYQGDGVSGIYVWRIKETTP